MRPPFALELRQRLAANKLSIRAFAAKVGVSSGYIGDVLKGRRGPADEADEWADALGLAGDDRTAFILSAALARTPPAALAYIAELEAMVAAIQRTTAVKAGPRKRRQSR